MKARCYQRGAEDNLTAVDCSGRSITNSKSAAVLDEERTVSNEKLHRDAGYARRPPWPRVPPQLDAAVANRFSCKHLASAGCSQSCGAGQIRRRPSHSPLFLFLLFVGGVAAAFYAGMVYQRQRHFTANSAAAQAKSDAGRNRPWLRSALTVDADPQKWLVNNLPPSTGSPSPGEGVAKLTDSTNPEFLYLYGRALMLTGNQKDAHAGI